MTVLNDSNAAREQFGFWLGMLARQWRAEVDRRLSPFILTEARWMILFRLSTADHDLTQKELARMAGVQGPTLVRTLDWLESKKLIERREVPDDRRAKTVHLTDKAAPALRQIQAVIHGVRAQIFADVSDTEIEQCLAVFKKIGGQFDAFSGAVLDKDIIMVGQGKKE
ncbi:MarR family transcriptional regulator [Thalassospira alkalitolerans]|uniref:MarR family transcriptional regulator n=1 Tax=Thalassospira alkalitolerans TaxID=1293890 RepID=A0A1Y2LBA7_9PROT|nr:MarR family transcriptional regulator [Thalassospira alkalitolerans]OSQ48007.1 MarR family transcriptional regulator [Thalassospira alkalitolerans]